MPDCPLTRDATQVARQPGLPAKFPDHVGVLAGKVVAGTAVGIAVAEIRVVVGQVDLRCFVLCLVR
jgi:hypothetical protein